MSDYWEQREQEWLYNSTLTIAEKELAKEYIRVYRKTQSELIDLYNELVNEKGEILVSDLFRFNRYYELLDDLHKNLYRLGIEEERLFKDVFVNYYRKNCEILGERYSWYFPANEDELKQVINGVWCADGKNWSSRIWSNTEQLQQRIQEGIVESFTKGISKDDLVRRLMEDFNVGFNQADRIARTELAYIRNKSSLDSYEKMGLEKYEVLANQADDESCGECNGKQFLLHEAKVGINFPPFHPNCKCCIIPVI